MWANRVDCGATGLFVVKNVMWEQTWSEWMFQLYMLTVQILATFFYSYSFRLPFLCSFPVIIFTILDSHDDLDDSSDGRSASINHSTYADLFFYMHTIETWYRGPHSSMKHNYSYWWCHRKNSSPGDTIFEETEGLIQALSIVTYFRNTCHILRLILCFQTCSHQKTVTHIILSPEKHCELPTWQLTMAGKTRVGELIQELNFFSFFFYSTG